MVGLLKRPDEEQAAPPMGPGMSNPMMGGEEAGETEASDAGAEESNVSPEEQAQYDRFVDNAYKLAYNQKTFPKVLESLKGGGDPVAGLAQTAVGIVLQLAQSAAKSGTKISGDVMMHGGAEILEDLADTAKKARIHDYTDEEIEAATLQALDMAREMMTAGGMIDPNVLKQEFAGIVKADQEGKLGQMFPGIEKTAKAAPTEEDETPEEEAAPDEERD